MTDRKADVARIGEALEEAARIARRYDPTDVEVKRKTGGSPVTAADHELDAFLRENLPRPGEGWLSEETADDARRLECRRVWIVDPIDGTKEFVEGLPEWCISIGLVEDGVPVAGGICNPATDELMLGSRETGVTLNGEPATFRADAPLEGARVLASRSEVRRGEWDEFDDASFDVVPMGSVAYKLGLVSVGKATATWTLVPKNEWDVAGGAALIEAAGGVVLLPTGDPLRFNRPDPLLPGFVAIPDPERGAGWWELVSEFKTRF